MNYLKTFAITLLFTVFAFHSSFANQPEDDPNSELRSSITKLLKISEVDLHLNEDVRISFFITNDNQVVVLKTDARSNKLDKHIKTSLNYQKIKIKDLEVNRIFHMKVHFLLK